MSDQNEVFEYLIAQLRQQVNSNQCEDLAHEVRSLKNQLRDASAQIKELHKALATATGDVEAYKLIREQEQSGCRKEDTQECEHDWLHSKHKSGFVCFNCGARKEDTQGCSHSFYYVVTDGSAPFGTKVCKTCGGYF